MSLLCLVQSLMRGGSAQHLLKAGRQIRECTQVLCLQLQRARWKSSGSLEKLGGHVSFPLCLDLSPYCCASAQPLLGQLAPSASSRKRAAMSKPQHKSSQAPSSQPCNTACEGNNGDLIGPHSHEQTAKQSCTPGGRSSQQQPYSSRNCYNLIAVVVHHGTAASGHYSTYRRLDECMHADKSDCLTHEHSAACIWVCASDEHVRWADVEEVLACQASILFYKKVKG